MTPTSGAAGADAGNRTRTLGHPAPHEIRVESVLHALADPVRLRIVRQLADASDELNCACFALPVAKSTSTHHFRVLRESGVIRQVYRGTAKLSVLRRDDLDTLFPGLLDSVLLAAGLQAVRLEAEPRGGGGTAGPAGR
ncbi:helix-turn-helix transcriptional regulator [uncultured Streptomyces sp.]|uniref:ArsR/SmtB family transcription factor n=1 Tax=uncultured Streptomyces sp. TaxID=174707 RepID=UPI0026106429|nr:helix-turn-helix transcriptional regulator [uncultured Streptomyces sp.]